MKVEEGVRLALDLRRRAEDKEDQNTRLNTEEEETLVGKARMKSEEEDLRLKSEDKTRFVEKKRLKDEQ